jgi:hypothetical protein
MPTTFNVDEPFRTDVASGRPARRPEIKLVLFQNEKKALFSSLSVVIAIRVVPIIIFINVDRKPKFSARPGIYYFYTAVGKYRPDTKKMFYFWSVTVHSGP